MRIHVTLLLIAALGVSQRLAADQHWNEFRGAHGDGQARTDRFPLEWNESNNVRWKTAIRGKAWSSPVVWGDRIWMTSATEDGTRLYAICVDADTGRIVHDITVFEIEDPMFCFPFNSYASPTPVVQQDRLWVHYGSAGTACLDTTTGQILWTRQDLPCDHHRGPGSSPIVFGDLVFINFDGYDVQYVVALDKHTGRTVWRQDRNIDYDTHDGDLKKAYGTPTVVEHEGRLQLISPAAMATISYDPLTGDQLWKVYHGGYNTAPRPLYTHGMVIINPQNGLRLLAVRPDGHGDVTDTHIVWSYGRSTSTRPSQLVVDDHLYMVSDMGIVTCLDVLTGDLVWVERMGGRHTASPIYAAGRIYMFDEEDTTRVIQATPEGFRLLAENTLEDGCMASPAVLDDALILRTKTHLYRIQETGPDPNRKDGRP